MTHEMAAKRAIIQILGSFSVSMNLITNQNVQNRFGDAEFLFLLFFLPMLVLDACLIRFDPLHSDDAFFRGQEPCCSLGVDQIENFDL